MWTLSHSQRFTLNGSEPSTSYEHLTLNEALSGIFGSISLAAWIFLLVCTTNFPLREALPIITKVLSHTTDDANNFISYHVQIPQLVENYRQQSADGISLAFLAVWFIGDIASLAGGLWANLVPTVIALSVYFCIADLVLVIQCLYYNKLNARHKLAQHDSTIDGPARKSSVHSRNSSSTAASSEDLEHQPLLSRRRSSDNLGLPGSHQRRRSSAVKKASAALLQQSGNSDNRSSDTSTVDGAAAVDFPDILEANDAGSHAWIKNSVSIVVICIAGVVGWFLAWRARVWRPTPVDGDDATVNMSFSAEALGYISALCYLG